MIDSRVGGIPREGAPGAFLYLIHNNLQNSFTYKGTFHLMAPKKDIPKQVTV
jgi:hypothetical protein